MVTVFTIIIASALILFVGLVYDGGRALDGRVRALNEAQEAARAGAQALNIGALRAGSSAILDSGAAVNAAQTFLAGTGDTGTVDVAGTTVTVSVTHVQPTTFLGMVGVGAMTAHVTASAKAEQGT
ncbi:pilus assembly protein TadG-related protein [Catenulispora pinisilvae]|uniref:pilus assembly protein TadG-related protein n=1 Tax=Catenulispora pinisilvae TaxID=2705253 RepID=UPI0018927DFC|nr:pilus assembly protein TadG-related protein [Catenulispora pinisilvae]